LNLRDKLAFFYNFWDKFPVLTKIARNLFTTPAINVPSEQIFKVARDVFEKLVV
jgi:hypothetical protein